MRFICIDDYEKEAFTKLPLDTLDYYRGGSGSEETLRANRESFKRWKLLPRFLRDVSSISMSLEIFGEKISCPIGAAPTAMQKLAHPDGELGTAKAISHINSIMILSTLSTTTIEDLAKESPETHKWFQLYLFKDKNESAKLIKRAEESGFKAIVLTVDTPRFAIRRRDLKNDFKFLPGLLANFDSKQAKNLQTMDIIDESLNWKDIVWLCGITSLPVLVKGVLTSEDSLMALEHGVSGIIVSNHGGRQLDEVPATIEVLNDIVRAVAGRCPVFVDGGVRTGTDVFKCLALGATMVFVGRPVLWGLACGGLEGVTDVMKLLRDELESTMALAGSRTLKEIVSDMVIHQVALDARNLDKTLT